MFDQGHADTIKELEKLRAENARLREALKAAERVAGNTRARDILRDALKGKGPPDPDDSCGQNI